MEHYHLMKRKLDTDAKEAFITEEISTDKERLYADFRWWHDKQPTDWRFAWCNDKECLKASVAYG